MKNPVLAKLRRTARTLGKPQAVVAANWIRAGLIKPSYSATRQVGITRAEHAVAVVIITRLAKAAQA